MSWDQVYGQRDFVMSCASLYVNTPDDIDDLVQSVWEKVWVTHRSLRHGTDVRKWLFVVVRHQAIDMYRRASVRAAAEPVDPDALLGGVLGDRTADGWDGFDNEHVEAALMSLSPERRRLVWLVDVEGYKYSEAAEALGLPVGTVMSSLSRARAAMRASLGGAA